jgi:hypothetical protein
MNKLMLKQSHICGFYEEQNYKVPWNHGIVYKSCQNASK